MFFMCPFACFRVFFARKGVRDLEHGVRVVGQQEAVRQEPQGGPEAGSDNGGEW